jgi:predicted RND superfamily exporter protein
MDGRSLAPLGGDSRRPGNLAPLPPLGATGSGIRGRLEAPALSMGGQPLRPDPRPGGPPLAPTQGTRAGQQEDKPPSDDAPSQPEVMADVTNNMEDDEERKARADSPKEIKPVKANSAGAWGSTPRSPHGERQQAGEQAPGSAGRSRVARNGFFGEGPVDTVSERVNSVVSSAVGGQIQQLSSSASSSTSFVRGQPTQQLAGAHPPQPSHPDANDDRRLASSFSGGGVAPHKRQRERTAKLAVFPMGALQQGSAAPRTDDVIERDQSVWLTDKVVQHPCVSLLMVLLLPLGVTLLTLLRVTITVDFDISSFEIRESHFSQQRLRSMEEAVRLENVHYTARRQLHGQEEAEDLLHGIHRATAPPNATRRQLWTNPENVLGRLELIYAPTLALDLIERPDLVETYRTTGVEGSNPAAGKADTVEMLTPDRLDYMRRLEQGIQLFEGYTKWCKVDAAASRAGSPAPGGSGCAPPSSLVSYLYPSLDRQTCELVRYDGSGTKLVRPLRESLTAMKTLKDYHWFFSTSHTEFSSTLVRSEFTFALPWKPTEEEKEGFEAWMGDLLDSLENERGREDFGSGHEVGVTVLMGGEIPTEILVKRELNSDIWLAAISFLIVLLYTWFHTTSLVLALMAMAMIGLSFPVAVFLYDLFFGHADLGVLNILSVYIVLGIGVDDCYVFLDAFQQSRNARNMEQAFGAAFNRSARAMFITSFTTALAFLANMVSSIPVIFSFAVFMATLVFLNFIFTITIFVAMVAVWHEYVEAKEQLLWKKAKATIPCLEKLADRLQPATVDEATLTELELPPAAPPAPEEQFGGVTQVATMDDFATLEDAFVVIDETAPMQPQARQRPPSATPGNSSKSDQRTAAMILRRLKQNDVTYESLRGTERFFLFKYGPCLTRHRRHVLVVAGLTMLLGLVLATQLEPSRDIPHLFPRDHVIQLHWEFKTHNFTAGNCDECAAAFNPNFLCQGNTCGGLNACMFGECYARSGNSVVRLTAALTPCTFDNQELNVKCAMSFASSRNGGPATTTLASDMLAASFGVWEPLFSISQAGCSDDYRECFAWAERGECQDNPSFMKFNCRFSCNLCHQGVENLHECQDNVDNDQDMLADCDDADCSGLPKCAAGPLANDEELVVIANALIDTQCRANFIDPFLATCQNTDQRIYINSKIAAICSRTQGGATSHSGLQRPPICDTANDSTYFSPVTPPPPPLVGNLCPYLHFIEDDSAIAPSDQRAVTRCLCDGKEQSFYIATGLLALALAIFLNYAGHLALKRRANNFEHKLCMLCAVVWYSIGVPPLFYWLACQQETDTKESGFMVTELIASILSLCGIAAFRVHYRRKCTENKALAAEYFCFVLFSTILVFAGSLYGTIRTYDQASVGKLNLDEHLISECGQTRAYNTTFVNEEAERSSSKISSQLHFEVCAPSNGVCGDVETMTYSAIGGILVTLTFCTLAGLAFGTLRKVPPSINYGSVGAFLVHGVLNVFFLLRCVDSEESQESAYFWALFLWSVATACGQVGHAVHKKRLGDYGVWVLTLFSTGWAIFAAIGIIITSFNGKQWLGICESERIYEAEGELPQFAGPAESSESKQSMYSDSVAGKIDRFMQGQCVVEDECGSLEASVYGIFALILLLGVCQVVCLRGCRIVNFPKSVDRVTISLWTVHTLIFYVFWITCAASDKTVEKGFWLTMLIWSVFLTVILVIYGIANSQMDHAWKAQVVLAVAFMAISSVSVHVTLTNDQQILGDCAVYERCHWWDEGLAATETCATYWSRLDTDPCSNTRCSGHGICVGFKYTGGCVCSPSYTGRFCTQEMPVNTNKAVVNFVFGMEGIAEEIGTVTNVEDGSGTFARKKAVKPLYWPHFNFAEPAMQTHIAEFCDHLYALDDVLQSQSLMCFMTDFRKWVNDNTPLSFPVHQGLFLQYLRRWLSTDGGKYFMHIGFDRNPTLGTVTRMSYARISVFTKLSKFEAGFSALPTFNKLENTMAFYNEKTSSKQISVYPAFQTSKLWTKMFTEISAINGIVYAMAIIAFCSFFTIFAFTGHVRMALIVVLNVFGMLCTILGYFKIVGWSLGVVEAVSALVLIGSSVDYSLHVAEAFVESSQQNRRSVDPFGRMALVTQALTKIGVSVFHAALTTLLSVIMLLFCNVTLFVKFGQIILVSVVISIIFALVPLPAMLGMLGPKRFRRSFKRQIFMLAAMVSLTLCCLVILYGLDASGRIELVGPAGEPLFGRAVRVDNGALDL